jgi:hypothetical protein
VTPQEFLTIIVRHTSLQLSQLIQTGAQWELSAHGLIANALLQATGRLPVREMPYKRFVGDDAGNEACDLVIQDRTQLIWVEAKVESAHHQLKFSDLSAKKVTDLDTAVNWDVEKLSWLKPEQFNVTSGDKGSEISAEPFTLSKWILVIAWSPKGKSKVQEKGGPNIFSDMNTNILFWIGVV